MEVVVCAELREPEWRMRVVYSAEMVGAWAYGWVRDERPAEGAARRNGYFVEAALLSSYVVARCRVS